MMVTDTSGSMLAKDVRPDRLTAAREAARALTGQVPEDFRLGLSSSARAPSSWSSRRPTARGWSAALAPLQVAGAHRDGRRARARRSTRPRTPIPDGLGGTRRLPTAIVLLSDGASTRGADPIDIAQQRQAGQDPDLHRRARHARAACSRPSARTARRAARRAAGHADAAGDRARRPAAATSTRPTRASSRRSTPSLGTPLRDRQEKQEMTAAFAGGGLVLLLGGLAFSLLRGGRLP